MRLEGSIWVWWETEGEEIGGNEGDRRLLHVPLKVVGLWYLDGETGTRGGWGNHVFSLSLVNLSHFRMVLAIGN